MLDNWIKGIGDSFSLKEANLALETVTHIDQLDSLQEYNIAILAQNSDRVLKIKESLGLFYNYFDNIRIIDLGFLIKDDPIYNIQLFLDLYQSNIITITIDKSFHWFSAIASVLYKNYPKTHNLCISNGIPFTEYGLITDYLGFQRHLVNKKHLFSVSDHSINSMSLGKMRAEKSLVEPILRDVWNIYFDVAAIRKADASGSFNSLPSGLSCEEACQIFKHLGNSSHLKNIVIGGDFTPDDLTCNTIAEMIWYFMEGHNNIENGHPSLSYNLKEYLVENEEMDETFVFVYNDMTNQWWFQIEDSNEYVACSKEEYFQTVNDVIPNRLLLHHTKIRK